MYNSGTRQVYNGLQTSNLSQQRQQNFWSKIIFEQQNQKIFPKKKFKFWKNKIWGKKIFEKQILKKIEN